MNAITDMVNLLLAGKFDKEIAMIIYNGRRLAISKKDDVIQSIAVGNILRRLAVKCTNKYVINGRSQALQPTQLGVGVAGGAEAAIHTMRQHFKLLPACHAVVKLDFTNAFNSIRRELLLETVVKNTPELHHFTFSTTLINGNQIILSREGSQQGDPLSSLEFFESIQPLLTEVNSEVDIGFMDDTSLLADLDTPEMDITKIIKITGLKLKHL